MKNKPRHHKSRRTVKPIATSTIATLLTASSAQATIYTNTMLGLSGFTVGDAGANSYSWDIDNSGSKQVAFAKSFYRSAHTHLIPATGYDTSHNTTTFTTRRYLRVVSNAGYFGFLMSGSNLVNKPPGAAINVTSSFNMPYNLLKSGASYRLAGFTSGTKGYIGFTFHKDGTTCYGWASFTYTANYGGYGTIAITEWAYDDSGLSIVIGQVPEPTAAPIALAALALGAAGLRRWRKRAR